MKNLLLAPTIGSRTSVWDKPPLRNSTRESAGAKAIVAALQMFLAEWLASDAAMTVNLEGVRSRPAPLGLKRLMAKSLARRSLVSYEVVTPPADEPTMIVWRAPR